MQRKKQQEKPGQYWTPARLFAEKPGVAATRFDLSQIKKTAGKIKAGGLRMRISGDPGKVSLAAD
jgi:hypothetical protein